MALTEIKTSGIADDAVTTDKLANAINTERTANTAKVSLDADSVTGAKIADDAVGAEHIEQLDADLSFADDAKAKFGASNDLEVFHLAGGDSYVDSNSGQLYVRSNNSIYIQPADNENGVVCNANGAVELYHNGTKQCETHQSGIQLPKGVINGMGGSWALLGGTLDPSSDKTWSFPFNTNHAGTNCGYEFTVEVVFNHWNHGSWYKILTRHIFGRGNTTSYQSVDTISNAGTTTEDWDTAHFEQSINLSGGTGGFPAALEFKYDSEDAPSYTSGYHIMVRHSGTMGIPTIS